MSFDIMVEKGAIGHSALKTHSRILWLSTSVVTVAGLQNSVDGGGILT